MSKIKQFLVADSDNNTKLYDPNKYKYVVCTNHVRFGRLVCDNGGEPVITVVARFVSCLECPLERRGGYARMRLRIFVRAESARGDSRPPGEVISVIQISVEGEIYNPGL